MKTGPTRQEGTVVRRRDAAGEARTSKSRRSIIIGIALPVFVVMGLIIGAGFAVLQINKNRDFDRFEFVKIDGIDKDEVSPETAGTWNVEVNGGLVIEMTRPEDMTFVRGAELCAAIFISSFGTLTAEPATVEDCQRRSNQGSQ